MSEQRMWMVRAGEDGRLFDEFKSKGIVAIGWDKLGDLSTVKNLDHMKELIRKEIPEASDGQVNIWASQMNRFRFEFHKEDYVVSYNAENRVYLVGKIEGEYVYDKTLNEYRSIRKIKWMKEVSRDALSASTKNSLGAISTIFEVPSEAKNEILGVLEGKTTKTLEIKKDEKDEELVKDNTVRNSRDFVKDKVTQLNWEQMQDLVAGVLKAMGYKILFIASRGPDGGKDIIASPDGLGLEDPRIRVEVKHRKDQQMGRKEVSSFIGGLRPGHRGLFVSTGGFSKDARDEADRSNVPLTLIDLDMLLDLVIENYDKFDSESKELLPLTKIYWPE